MLKNLFPINPRKKQQCPACLETFWLKQGKVPSHYAPGQCVLSMMAENRTEPRMCSGGGVSPIGTEEGCDFAEHLAYDTANEGSALRVSDPRGAKARNVLANKLYKAATGSQYPLIRHVTGKNAWMNDL